MLISVILIVLLIMFWITSCVWCFLLGVRTEKKEQLQRNKRRQKKATNIHAEQVDREYMRQLENLFSYDGTVQE